MSDALILQAPVCGRSATLYIELWRIVTHPAFRLGFLDARAGRGHDHFDVVARIERETPVGALKRLGWRAPSMQLDLVAAPRSAVDLAQYRYEEGRLLFLVGVRCRAWGHPDFPPAGVVTYIRERSEPA